eukprot:scaffold58071_cov48-Attheya_sp.AAC.1
MAWRIVRSIIDPSHNEPSSKELKKQKYQILWIGWVPEMRLLKTTSHHRGVVISRKSAIARGTVYAVNAALSRSRSSLGDALAFDAGEARTRHERIPIANSTFAFGVGGACDT